MGPLEGRCAKEKKSNYQQVRGLGPLMNHLSALTLFDNLHHMFGAFAKLQKAAISSVMSASSSPRNNSVLIRRFFMKFVKLSIFRKPVTKIQVSLKSEKKNKGGNLHDDICTTMITSRAILLRIRNVSDTIFSFSPCILSQFTYIHQHMHTF